MNTLSPKIHINQEPQNETLLGIKICVHVHKIMILRLSWFPVGPQVSDWGPDEVKEYYNLKYRDTVRCIKREADI